ncbi:alpha/beta hydrolase [Paenibacillus pasadenensis]|uniref:alpha/beta fold hydrolase n=1 Tax=Paenibacillus pasadenensis TaxID=217090 RepID=UPI00203E932E|nr:alpha/beta hydrolase [Paenibacillus pasadenensis]MCM3750334.1 alpha/beta hydrolase [Paenibacillus pasadenensis]
MSSAIKGQAVQVSGSRVWTEVSGTADRGTVLLFHAAIADSRLWDNTVPALHEAGYRTVCFDMPGMGQSELPEGEYTVYETARELLKELGIGKVSLVGVSAGSHCALEFAAAYPELTEKLALVNGSIFGSIEYSEQMQHDDAAFEQVIGSGDMSAAARVWTEMWLDGPGQPSTRVNPDVREAFQRYMMERLPSMQTYRYPRMMMDLVNRLPELDIPVLSVSGALDYADTFTLLPLLEQGLKDWRGVVLEHSAHFPMLDDPAGLNRALIKFFGE